MAQNVPSNHTILHINSISEFFIHGFANLLNRLIYTNKTYKHLCYYDV